jgi:hypothetical protein
MSDEQESADRSPGPAASAWVMNERQPGRFRRFVPMFVVILVGLPFIAVLAFGMLELWSAAASDCQVFEAGDRLFNLVIVWPISTVVLWFGYSLPILLLGRRSLRLSLPVAVIVVTALVLWFLSGTGAMIRADVDGQAFCPTGVPDWWPAVLPH